MMQPDQLDEDIRKLTGRMTTRQIVRELAKHGVHIAQSTVVRRQQSMGINNTGPNQVLDSGYRPRRKLPPGMATAAVAVALILLAVAAVVLLMTRVSRPDQSGPVDVCVRYGAAGAVTGIAAGGGCPPGWQTVTLIPSR